jgi:hypothetical protein
VRARIIFGAQMADLAAFMVGVSAVGIGGESNVAMGGLYALGGMTAVVLVKSSGAVALAYMGPKAGRWWILPAVAGLLGAATAIATVARAA